VIENILKAYVVKIKRKREIFSLQIKGLHNKIKGV